MLGKELFLDLLVLTYFTILITSAISESNRG